LSEALDKVGDVWRAIRRGSLACDTLGHRRAKPIMLVTGDAVERYRLLRIAKAEMRRA
jgi:hypothetical protein